MELLEKNSEKYVRIIIGESQRKYSGVHKPIKVITLTKTTVDEVYKIIDKLLRENIK